MDYSLLLSVFNVDHAKKQRLAELQGPGAAQSLPTVAEQAGASEGGGYICVLLLESKLNKERILFSFHSIYLVSWKGFGKNIQLTMEVLGD